MIHSVVLHMGDSDMDVIAVDRVGSRRKIRIIWGKEPKTDIPPDDWPSLVEAEMEVQRSYEAAVAEGRIIPHDY